MFVPTFSQYIHRLFAARTRRAFHCPRGDKSWQQWGGDLPYMAGLRSLEQNTFVSYVCSERCKKVVIFGSSADDVMARTVVDVGWSRFSRF